MIFDFWPFPKLCHREKNKVEYDLNSPETHIFILTRVNQNYFEKCRQRHKPTAGSGIIIFLDKTLIIV